MVMRTLDTLYDTLLESGLHRKGVISSKLKSQILKCVYRFVERPEDKLLLKLARVVFCVSATNCSLKWLVLFFRALALLIILEKYFSYQYLGVT